ncbi:hypothetical protein DPMN_051106 [Dreissena polymorpha]|uniref:Uncharacterized protein n=1 Tax=Dreissena polymorpha TaxID=45954 RepID=A0A9D4CIS7_DREPO|nr:hypothetical protein DPMN_051106 [Dreissena polymorpha]
MLVFTCFHYIHIEKTAPQTGDHVFSPIWTIFELVGDINKINVLTKFNNDRAKNVTSGLHVFERTGTKTNVLIKFYEDWTINVTSRVFICFHNIHIEKTAPPPPTGGHVFSMIWTIFELGQDINKTNVLTKFHDDWAKIVTSRLFTRFLYSQITAPPTCVSNSTEISFGTKLLTKFHEDPTRNVASRVFTHKCRQRTDGRTDG